MKARVISSYIMSWFFISAGPQTRFASRTSAMDFLTVFGLDTDENKTRLNNALDMCIAVIDAESTTTWATDDMDDLTPISESRRTSGQVGYQSLLLFGYADRMDADVSHKVIFSILENDPMEQFVSHAQKRRRYLAGLKEKELSPFKTFIEKARLVHRFYFKRHAENLSEDDIEIAFASTLFGQFEKKLSDITGRMILLGFNSAKYDNVLVYKSLAKAVHRRGKVLKISKKGSAISKLSWNDGDGKILMTDIAEMLSPGISLAKFVETANIEMKKGLFPFR